MPDTERRPTPVRCALVVAPDDRPWRRRRDAAPSAAFGAPRRSTSRPIASPGFNLAGVVARPRGVRSRTPRSGPGRRRRRGRAGRGGAARASRHRARDQPGVQPGDRPDVLRMNWMLLLERPGAVGGTPSSGLHGHTRGKPYDSGTRRGRPGRRPRPTCGDAPPARTWRSPARSSSVLSTSACAWRPPSTPPSAACACPAFTIPLESVGPVEPLLLARPPGLPATSGIS